VTWKGETTMATMGIDPFSTARDMLQLLDAGDVSAAELTAFHIERIERYDGRLNAVVVRDFERALETAREADEARARGERQALLGLPMTVKDAFYVDGLSATGGGILERADVIADWDSPIVASLRAAGIVIMGKTNMPPYAADYQTFNPLFGRTNNPWDLERTPGGSSGGAAAALAAGLTPLEIGGDYGGSIREPAAYCGIFGHKSSETALPRTGHFPGGKLPNAAFAMAVQGPLARSAGDLQLVMDLVSGPTIGEDVAWRLELPASRHERLEDFRVAILPRFDWQPVDEEILAELNDLSGQLLHLGATVEHVAPPGIDFREYLKTNLRILFAQSAGGVPIDDVQAIIRDLRASGDEFLLAAADGWEASAGDYLKWFSQREEYRAALRDFFRDWDILLAPCSVSNAFPHDERPFGERELLVNGTVISEMAILFYPGLCNLSGHPGTAFPTGLSRYGLPIGLQAIGPYLEDRTAIRFAELVEREFGGFTPPADFVN
jgi:amidase